VAWSHQLTHFKFLVPP